VEDVPAPLPPIGVVPVPAVELMPAPVPPVEFVALPPEVDAPLVGAFPGGRAASSPHAAVPTNIGMNRTQLRAGRVSEGGSASFIGRSSVWDQGGGPPLPSVRKL
jgi:hypothetical protein